MLRFLYKLSSYRFELINLIVGAVVLAFELTASRVVAPYIGTTIYIWTSIIGVILGSLAIGYMIGGYLGDKRHRSEDIIFMLILAALLISAINFLKDWLLNGVSSWGIALQIEALVASLLLFAPPTIVLGAILPYLVRLSINKVSTSGRQVARINSAGTLGSLLGTFITGYFLFGFLGTKYILGWLAVCLVLSTFILSLSFLGFQRLLLIGILITFTFVPPNLQVSSLTKDIDTRYNRAIVRNIAYRGRSVKVLQLDSLFLQSGIYDDGDDSLVFPYTQSFAAISKLDKDAANFLVIGGGAFTFPAYLAKNFPDANVSVVEIDDKLAAISQAYFNFRPQKNLRVHYADGRQFLNNNSVKYDIIFLDAFNSFVPPFQLFTLESAKRMDASLNNNGLVVSNVFSTVAGPKSQLAKAVINTYGQIFSNVNAYNVKPAFANTKSQNITIVASNNNLPDEIVNDGVIFKKIVIKNSSHLVLTDDFAPVERLAANSY